MFDREGCGGCHTAPLYTNNKLTLASGWAPPKDHPYRADMLMFSVVTEPEAAMTTRKGTGLYKSRHFGACGIAACCPTMVPPPVWKSGSTRRLQGQDYVPKGFKGYNVQYRAVPGHEYGLKLASDDKASLIAFLRTL